MILKETNALKMNRERSEGVNLQLRKLTEERIERDTKIYGIQDWKKVLDFNKSEFSIRKFREGSYAAALKLKESQAELAFGQLLRAGVQNIFNDIYQKVEVTYEVAVRKTSSNKRQEFYAPIERIGFPKRVQEGAPFPETSFKGLDIELVNVKYGMMYDVPRELVDDDQTGQIVQEAGYMAENARILEEAYVWNRMVNGTLSLDGQPLPQTVTWALSPEGNAGPYSSGVSGVSGGLHGSGWGVNATTAARLSQSQIQAGWVLAKQMLDRSGRPMLVDPKLLAVSPQDIFFAEQLINSDYNPSVPSGTAGATGSYFSINAIKNLVGVVASRFITNYGALLIDPKAFAFQVRDPQEVVQENPQSGPAFSQDIFRYRNRSRWEADFIDPKFIINLNTSFSPT